MIISWIFDITPEGIKKTESIEETKEQSPTSSPTKRGLKASDVIIAVLFLAVCVLLYPKIFKTDKFEDIRDTDEISIAVLPFTNMSSDIEQEYFCDGIAEDILNDLTQLEGLHVIARTSSFAFKDKNQDIREIGLKLGAQTIVEGSVRKTENRLRITAQLINVADGYHLWSERYDRNLEDVFAIQNEIAKNIVQALDIKLNQRENRALGKAKTEDVQAYDFYIRGRDYYHQDHHDKTLLAIQMFKKAIQKDKNYALAYSGLADSYSKLYMYYDMNKENLQQALVASQKALELDNELTEAHSSRGLTLTQNNQFDNSNHLNFSNNIVNTILTQTVVRLHNCSNCLVVDNIITYGEGGNAVAETGDCEGNYYRKIKPENSDNSSYSNNTYCILGQKSSRSFMCHSIYCLFHKPGYP